MLQQTQVKTVIPFWERWMRALPTIQSLARARPEKLHKLWEGLGYYRRVRNMQKAAQLIVKRHGGSFPTAFEDVLELPGVGRYTAGAICSIAFNQPRPILDGNVIRVLSRVFGIEGNPRDSQVNARLWTLAERLVREAGDSAGRARFCSQFNQSLMELGALVCVPRRPNCEICPLSNLCIARRQGRVETLPQLPIRPRTIPRRFVAFIVRRGGKVLVQQRPAEVINAHLWEFPNIEVANADGDVRNAARRVFGAAPRDVSPLCTIRHSITRYRIRLDVFQVNVEGPAKTQGTSGRWLTRSQLARVAFAGAHKKIMSKL